MVFDFEGREVRTIDRDGVVWFVLADICRVLAITNNRNVTARLDDDEKDVHTVDTPGGTQEVTIINESGLYSLILTSRKESAKRFKKWLTAEVLPTLRRTGRYEIPPVAPTGDLETGEESEYGTAEVNSALAVVREVRKIFGRAAARRIWNECGALPMVYPETEYTGLDSSNGEACLAWLLGASADGGGVIGDLVRDARHSAASADRLRMMGIRVCDKYCSGGVLVANAHPALRRVFANTKWATGWRSALLSMPGALPSGTNCRFGPIVSRGVVVPVSVALPVREVVAA
jgi:prophage antirepressor-like protein